MPGPGDQISQLITALHGERNDMREGLYQMYLNGAKANPETYYNPLARETRTQGPYSTAHQHALTDRIKDENVGRQPDLELRDVEHALFAQKLGRIPSAVLTPAYSLAKLLFPQTGYKGGTPATWQELKWGLRPFWGKD